MNIDLKEDFIEYEKGTSYGLPTYSIVDNVGIQRTGDTLLLDFVRGSKLGEEDVEKRIGTLHEHLLSVMIHDLKFKNSLVPSREGALVITKLEEALGWLRQRQIDRIKRNVEGTYKK